MRRSLPLFWICAGAIIGLSSRGYSQTTYANLYWESSISPYAGGPRPQPAGGYWDSDVAAYAQQWQSCPTPSSYIAEYALMTRDRVDSMLHSMLASDWVNDLENPPYGVPAPEEPA